MFCMLLIVEPVGQRAARNGARGSAACAAIQHFGQALAAEAKLQAVTSTTAAAWATVG